jgi:hypothetical protein
MLVIVILSVRNCVVETLTHLLDLTIANFSGVIESSVVLSFSHFCAT